MKKIFVEDLIKHVGEEITECFLLKKIGQKASMDGKTRYVEIRFLDRTGEVSGYIYEDYMKAEYYAYSKRVVSVMGQVIVRKEGKPQIYISSMEEADVYEDNDYYNGLKPDEEVLLLDAVRQYIGKISHKGYRELTDMIYKEYEERIVHCPASLVSYNNYNGGILVHAVAVTGVAVRSAEVLEKYCRGQKRIDYSLLIAASLLHDVGKIDEFTTFPLAVRIGVGVLVTTGSLTQRLISGTLQKYGISLTKEEEYLLYHLIDVCSNEDQMIKPMCTEAIVLHQAFQMQTGVEILGGFLEGHKGEDGAIYDKRSGNYVYVRKKEESVNEKQSDWE